MASAGSVVVMEPPHPASRAAHSSSEHRSTPHPTRPMSSSEPQHGGSWATFVLPRMPRVAGFTLGFVASPTTQVGSQEELEQTALVSGDEDIAPVAADERTDPSGATSSSRGMASPHGSSRPEAGAGRGQPRGPRGGAATHAAWTRLGARCRRRGCGDPGGRGRIATARATGPTRGRGGARRGVRADRRTLFGLRDTVGAGVAPRLGPARDGTRGVRGCGDLPQKVEPSAPRPVESVPSPSVSPGPEEAPPEVAAAPVVAAAESRSRVRVVAFSRHHGVGVGVRVAPHGVGLVETSRHR